jgi:hypothetical protein
MSFASTEKAFGPESLPDTSTSSVSRTPKYATLLQRILANAKPVSESETSCRLWAGDIRSNYPRLTLWCPERKENISVSATRACLIAVELGSEREWFWDLYRHYSFSGLEAEHNCRHPWCVNPDHLEWLTKHENLARRVFDNARGIR